MYRSAFLKQLTGDSGSGDKQGGAGRNGGVECAAFDSAQTVVKLELSVTRPDLPGGLSSILKPARPRCDLASISAFSRLDERSADSRLRLAPSARAEDATLERPVRISRFIRREEAPAEPPMLNSASAAQLVKKEVAEKAEKKPLRVPHRFVAELEPSEPPRERVAHAKVARKIAKPRAPARDSPHFSIADNISSSVCDDVSAFSATDPRDLCFASARLPELDEARAISCVAFLRESLERAENAQQYACRYCGERFSMPAALGGHTAKFHAGRNPHALKRQLIAKERADERQRNRFINRACDK